RRRGDPPPWYGSSRVCMFYHTTLVPIRRGGPLGLRATAEEAREGTMQRQFGGLCLLVALLAAQVTVAAAPAAQTPANREVILATTTSTYDTGLLDALHPLFERATGYQVKTISVGTGQALALGERAEADVVLVHAPEAERAWMAAGNGTQRLLVMYNDFVLVGPANDPAGVRGLTTLDALRRIAAAGSTFVSRGDNSGTHILEGQLWRQVGVNPEGSP